MSQQILSSYHRSFHVWEKGQKIGTNSSKNNYIVTEQLLMRRPFTFFSFTFAFGGQLIMNLME